MIVLIILMILTAICVYFFFKKVEIARKLLPFIGFLLAVKVIFLSIEYPLIPLVLIVYLLTTVLIGKKKYYKLDYKELDFKSPKLKNDYKIVFIADFQYDITSTKMNYKAFDNLIQKVNSIDKDIIVLGGDYINYSEHIDNFFQMLSKINIPEKGMYAVIGNHDYVDYDLVVKKFKDINVVVLENDKANICSDLVISGVEDEWFGKPKLPTLGEEYNILLAHNPDFIKKIPTDNNVDMMLSGHYHGGQFNPFLIRISRMVSKYSYGHFYEKDIELFVTSGVGGTFLRGPLGQYIRLFAPPEVTVIYLEGE